MEGGQRFTLESWDARIFGVATGLWPPVLASVVSCLPADDPIATQTSEWPPGTCRPLWAHPPEHTNSSPEAGDAASWRPKPARGDSPSHNYRKEDLKEAGSEGEVHFLSRGKILTIETTTEVTFLSRIVVVETMKRQKCWVLGLTLQLSSHWVAWSLGSWTLLHMEGDFQRSFSGIFQIFYSIILLAFLGSLLQSSVTERVKAMPTFYFVEQEKLS